MIQNIISGIIATITGGVALMFVAFVVSIALPKSAVIAMLKEKKILRAMRYLFTTFLLSLTALLLPLNKLFVFSVCLLFAFIVLMLVYDYAIAKFTGVIRSVEEKDIDNWTHQLAMCDRNDTERIKMIKAKLKELHK
ncbi:MAG: hypothetical protein JEZ14_14885 [Marinilabiliaceae bacterium]|nr:hypothetical protein [Marinilabiliaceae bacterium]